MARILHLSDLHFGAQNPLALTAAADLIRERPFDLMAVTGDITLRGSVLEFDAARRWFASLPGPKLFTPGNHDTPIVDLMARLTRPFARYEAAFGPARAGRFDGPALSVRAINTARGAQVRLNWSKGAIAPSQARSAVLGLAEGAPGALKVALVHHPLLEVVGGPMTGRVRGGPAAGRILADGGVDLILSGHLHAPFFVGLPFGDGRSYAVGAGTLSLRERGAPPGFNLIEADADAVTVTALSWTGSAFAPSRTWAAPRRAPAAALS